MAHDQHRALAGDGLDLLESGQDEDSGLSETRLGLADDVTSEKGLRNAILLNCRIDPMLEYGLARYERMMRTEGGSRQAGPSIVAAKSLVSCANAKSSFLVVSHRVACTKNDTCISVLHSCAHRPGRSSGSRAGLKAISSH